MTGLVRQVAELVHDLGFDDLGPGTVDNAKLLLLDSLAVGVAGSSTELAGIAERYAGEPRTGRYRAFPSAHGYPTAEAAGFVAGVYAFNQNYADTSLHSVGHPGLSSSRV